MKRPIESDYVSLTAYTRALEEYCEALAQPEQEPSPEWMTEEEQTAYTFGWFKALESKRMAQPEQEHVAWEQFYPDIGKPQLEMKVEGPRHVVCQCDKCKAQPKEPAIIGTYLEKDKELMENAQGDLERINLVQTGVGIGKPEQEPVALEALKWIASHDLSGADDRAIALMAYAFVSKARFAVLEATGELA